MSQKLWVVINAEPSEISAILAKEALTKSGIDLDIKLDIALTEGKQSDVEFTQQPTKDNSILFVDTPTDIKAKFNNAKTVDATIHDVLTDATKVIQSIDLRADDGTSNVSIAKKGKIKIVAVTSCPTGIAHTFMAAEGLQTGAEQLGYDIRVETQGSVGAQDPLTQAEIESADIIIIAADREVDRARFGGKRIYASGTKAAINNGAGYIETALKEARLQKGKGSESEKSESTQEERVGVYKHLMTGVSFMLPFVVAGGLLIALAFALGGINAGSPENAGTLAHALSTIGGVGFSLMVPALAGYIAFSIADRPGLAPGMIGGLLATQIGAGFLGGIVAGFLAGYGVYWLNRIIRLPRNLDGLKPVLILPLLGSLLIGLVMIYIIGEPVAAILQGLETWLRGLDESSALVIGAIIGGMMAVDLGGPVNKAAYATSVALISSGVYEPIAAVMAAGMTPPLAVAVATRVFKNKFTKDEYEAGIATGVLGLAFISEGAIPFAARDPLRVIPSFIVGSAATGAISMVLGCALKAPHGGVFVLFIPGAISNVVGYAVAIIVGTAISTVLLGILKRPVAPIQATS